MIGCSQIMDSIFNWGLSVVILFLTLISTLITLFVKYRERRQGQLRLLNTQLRNKEFEIKCVAVGITAADTTDLPRLNQEFRELLDEYNQLLYKYADRKRRFL